VISQNLTLQLCFTQASCSNNKELGGGSGIGSKLCVSVLEHGTKFGSTATVDSGNHDSLSSARRPSAARVAFSARSASGTPHVVSDSASFAPSCDSASSAESISQSTRTGIQAKRRSIVEDLGTPSAAHTMNCQGGTHKVPEIQNNGPSIASFPECSLISCSFPRCAKILHETLFFSKVVL
jgi:hypothetical protein